MAQAINHDESGEARRDESGKFGYAQNIIFGTMMILTENNVGHATSLLTEAIQSRICCTEPLQSLGATW